MERMVSLSVGTNGAEDYFSTYQDISELAKNLGESHNYVTVSAHVFGEESDEAEGETEALYYDDKTLLKVRRGLIKYGLSDAVATDLITNMQNEGILFRERPRAGN